MELLWYLLAAVTLSTTYSEVLSDDIYGRPLFLSQYARDGKAAEGKSASRVPSMLKGEDVLSYSGYLTINETYDSNYFFWFFPAENRPSEAPIVIWLQGGPGASSMYGLFSEHGPFFIDWNLELVKRSVYWSQEVNLIYFDNPIGTGFSFTKNDLGYANTALDVGQHLLEGMKEFYKIFPEYKKNRLYVSGESYAGKFIPAAGYAIHRYNEGVEDKINFGGIAIGDGWVDPRNMLVHSEHLYQLGLIDDKAFVRMKEHETKTAQLIDAGNFFEATKECDQILNPFYEMSGTVDVYNFQMSSTDDVQPNMNDFLSKVDVRRHLHVGNLTFNGGDIVARHLYNDSIRSAAPWLEVLMDNYNVIIFNGQLDLIIGYPQMIHYVSRLNWKGASDYQKAKRVLWYVDGELAGFAKNVGNFTEVLVRGSGHMVAADQPVRALDLITRFTQNIPFDFQMK